MDFQAAKQTADQLDAEVKANSAVLQAFPRNSIGLTSDAVKCSPEYRAAKAAFDSAFARLRRFNAVYTKRFAKELSAERQARRELAQAI